MNQLLEISEKLFQELEKRKRSPDETIEKVIWNLLEQVNTKTKNESAKAYTNKNFTSIWRNKTLKDVFG